MQSISRQPDGAEYERGVEDARRDVLADPRRYAEMSVDLAIERGQLDPAARGAAVEYSTLILAGREIAAARYLASRRRAARRRCHVRHVAAAPRRSPRVVSRARTRRVRRGSRHAPPDSSEPGERVRARRAVGGVP
jgi:hypothetical protein